ncbi:cytochrome P450 [Mycena sp. CBHHK59/15]|nr:cytochrome P450 [Mycena sp. CBHHK59/15]
MQVTSLDSYGATWSVLGLVILLYALHIRHKWFKLPLPPGPRGWPLVGNLFDLPPRNEWEAYLGWSKEYNSDIIHLDLAGTPTIILCSMEAINDLLEKRSSMKLLVVTGGLMGWDFNFGLMKYGDQWRAHRRLFHQELNETAAHRFRPKQLAASHELLRRILHNPDDVMDHFRHFAGEVIMFAAYGIDVLPSNDPYVALAKEAVDTWSIASIPGRFLVDPIPILRYVPSWLPGAGFKRKAKEWRKLARAMVDEPFAEVKRKMALGTASPSFTSNSLYGIAEAQDRDHQEQIVKSTAGTMYVGGADTAASALGTFILAMLANPDAQKKAQREVDSVTRRGYLPEFNDEAAMPYVAAVMKELLRWKPITPIANPHYLAVEDVYRGYRLPAGSVVIGNAWAILYDEAMYPDPYAFKPERFLLANGQPNHAVRSPDAAAFGYGRRICPGRYMAHSSIWIGVVSMLATFNITWG